MLALQFICLVSFTFLVIGTQRETWNVILLLSHNIFIWYYERLL